MTKQYKAIEMKPRTELKRKWTTTKSIPYKPDVPFHVLDHSRANCGYNTFT